MCKGLSGSAYRQYWLKWCYIVFVGERGKREREGGSENDSERGKEPAKSSETMVKILNPVQTNP